MTGAPQEGLNRHRVGANRTSIRPFCPVGLGGSGLLSVLVGAGSGVGKDQACRGS